MQWHCMGSFTYREKLGESVKGSARLLPKGKMREAVTIRQVEAKPCDEIVSRYLFRFHNFGFDWLGVLNPCNRCG